MTRTQQFVEKYKKVLTSGAAFYNPDTSLMDKSLFDKAKCKILLICPTPLVTKTVSSTVAAINDFIIEHCPDTFLDVAYFPEAEDIKHYDAWNVPYAIGHITHLDPSHFDIVGFSVSVLHEIVATPVMMKTFERCDKPIPLFWSQRKDCKLGEYPIFYAGGITAACGESMFGKVTLNGKVEQAYLDFMYLGDCGHTHHITNRFIEAVATGKVSRTQQDHDVPGYPHKEYDNFEEVVNVSTVQEYVESLFDLEEIYQPQAYDVEYNKHNQIIKNIKINPKARDYVHPYYPHIMAEDLGIGRTVIPANGDNVGVTQVQCSEGCSAGGQCSFCSEGAYTGGWVEKSEEEIRREMWESKKYSAAYKMKPFSFNCVDKDTIVFTETGFKRVSELSDEQIMSVFNFSKHKGIAFSEQPTLGVSLSQGPGLKLTYHHRQTVLTAQGLNEVKASELSEGMWIPQRIRYCVHNLPVEAGSFAHVLGFWYGDGYYGGNSSYILINKEEETELQCIIKSGWVERQVRDYQGQSVYLMTKEFTKKCKEVCPIKDNFDILQLSDTGMYLAFIRGLFDADGCGSGGFIKLTQKESRLKVFKDIQVILGSIGIRTRISKPTSVTLNGTTHFRRDLYVVGRESRETWISSIGSSIKHKLQYVKSNRTKWSDKDKCLPGLFGVWTYQELKKINKHTGYNVSKFFHGIDGLTVDRYLKLFSAYNIEPVRLVLSGVRFAQVNNITDEGISTVVDVTETTNGRWIANGYITHNTNYITDYKGQLGKWIRIFPKVTFLNMRMEELGRDPDALKMMKLVGSNRLSAPLEGMSPRIMNNLLNKCLSEEAIDNVMAYCVHGKMTDVKIGGIFTGYEEDEDFQWICDFFDKYNSKASEEGGNYTGRLKFTPLVHYTLTTLEYLERRSAKNSFLGERWLSDERYEKFKEHNISFKVNGFRYSTFLEQTFVDLGRSLTPLVFKHFVNEAAPIYSLRSCATEEYLDELRKIIDVDVYFNDRDIDHYISPCHRIHIDLMGSYIPRARRLLKAKHNGNIFDNPPDERCLLTRVGAKVKCYHNCAKDEPLQIYFDVEMDEEGNLHGTSYPLIGCQRCPTPAHRKARLARPIVSTMNSDSLVAVPRIPQVQKIRFVIKREKEYDVLNPNNTAHTFVTKFLQASDKLLKSYHSIVCHNMFWQCGPEFKYFTSGFQVVDTLWSANVISEVKSLVDKVNEELESVKVVSCQEVLRDEKIDLQDLNFFVFESTLGKEYFDAAAPVYKGQIYQEKPVQGFALELSSDPKLHKPFFISKDGKTVGAFSLPAKYNPVQYLRGYLSTVKKLSEDAIVTSTTFSCQFVARENRLPCKNCGKEKALISIITGKVIPFGRDCLSKVILSQSTKS